jgi:hypothetical protein
VNINTDSSIANKIENSGVVNREVTWYTYFKASAFHQCQFRVWGKVQPSKLHLAEAPVANDSNMQGEKQVPGPLQF